MEPDESRFLELYLTNGNNAAKAAQAVWPDLTYGSARTTAWRVLARAQGYIAAYMDDSGLTLEKLLTTLAEGLIATTPIVTKVVEYKDGKRHREVQKIAYASDFSTRHRYTETALKLRGALVPKPPEVIVIPTTVNNTQNNLSIIMDNQEVVDKFSEFYMEEQRQKLLANRKNKPLTIVDKLEEI